METSPARTVSGPRRDRRTVVAVWAGALASCVVMWTFDVRTIVHHLSQYVTLEPGDVLYVPRGWLHSATALGGVSVHLTIGVHVWHRHHLAEAVLDGTRRALAEQPELSPESQRYLARIRSAGAVLLGAVNDVLDLSKLDAGQVEIAAALAGDRDGHGDADAGTIVDAAGGHRLASPRADVHADAGGVKTAVLRRFFSPVDA